MTIYDKTNTHETISKCKRKIVYQGPIFLFEKGENVLSITPSKVHTYWSLEFHLQYIHEKESAMSTAVT